MTIKDKTCVAGVGTSEYGRRGEFAELSELDLIRAALDEALTDSGLDRSDIDGLATFSHGDSDPSSVGAMSRALGFRHVNFSASVLGGGGGGTCAAVANAAAAVAAGYAETVMVWKVIKQARRFGAAFAEKSASSNYGNPATDLARAHGLVAPGQMFALMVRRHMHRFGTKPVHLGAMAVTQRSHAMRNPKALMRASMTIEDHQASRVISDPFRLFDYCLESEGAVVVLVTSAARARNLKQPPTYVMAAAQGATTEWGQGMISQSAPEELYTSAGMRHIAERLYKMAGVEPKDVDVAELYDHFSGMVLLQLEDYGFCDVGESGPFVESGAALWPDGSIPVNTHGGNLSEVYLLGMTHIVEAVKQLRGTSTTQVRDAEIALVSSGPSPMPMSALLLRR